MYALTGIFKYERKIMEYKITQILHTGTCGESGTERKDGRYPLRIGRTVDLVLENIRVGYPMYLEYLKDSDGSDMLFKALITSRVKDVKTENNLVVVTTRNSIFYFRKM